MEINKTVEVLWVARYDYDPNWKLISHKHSYFQIIYFMEGEGYFCINDNKYLIGKDILLFVKPNELHSLNVPKDSSVKTMDMKFTIMDDDLRNEVMELDNVLTPKDPEIMKLLFNIKEEGLEKEYCYKTMSNMYLMQILLKLLRIQHVSSHDNTCHFDSYNLDQNADVVIRKSYEYIQQHFPEGITLDDLCRNIGYNKSYVCQKFKKNLECTPMQFIYEYRIFKSQSLITYSDYCLKDIALKTGFESIHHFTRKFHEFVGMTPGEYRDNERSQIRKDININDDFINEDLTDRNVK